MNKKFEIQPEKKIEVNKKFEIEGGRTKIMEDFFSVGPDKPLGYLPLSTIEDYSDMNKEQLIEEFSKRGLEARIIKETSIVSGALFVYDKKSLQKLLDENQHILENTDWPTNADNFVDRVATQFAEDPELYKLIGKAFADPRFTDTKVG